MDEVYLTSLLVFIFILKSKFCQFRFWKAMFKMWLCTSFIYRLHRLADIRYICCSRFPLTNYMKKYYAAPTARWFMSAFASFFLIYRFTLKLAFFSVLSNSILHQIAKEWWTLIIAFKTFFIWVEELLASEWQISVPVWQGGLPCWLTCLPLLVKKQNELRSSGKTNKKRLSENLPNTACGVHQGPRYVRLFLYCAKSHPLCRCHQVVFNYVSPYVCLYSYMLPAHYGVV